MRKLVTLVAWGLGTGRGGIGGGGSDPPPGLQIRVVFSMFFEAGDLQWFTLICMCFYMVFRCRRGLICSDLRGANQLQISANQRAEKHWKRHFANHVIVLICAWSAGCKSEVCIGIITTYNWKYVKVDEIRWNQMKICEIAWTYVKTHEATENYMTNFRKRTCQVQQKNCQLARHAPLCCKSALA